MANMENAQRHVSLKSLEGRHFDIGLFGVWYGENYGSVMTYYALNRVLKKLGLSVLMIDKPRRHIRDAEVDGLIHSRVFARKHFDGVMPSLPPERMRELNDVCDTFVVGCDQMWNYGIAKGFGFNNYLDFVDAEKRKISYATSFGHSVSFTPNKEIPIIAKLFRRFSAISVRERDAVKILRNEFGVAATQVLDPVFLLHASEYDEIISETKYKESQPYALSYILDPTSETARLVKEIAREKGLKLITILDGRGDVDKIKSIVGEANVLDEVDAPTWLWYIKNADFVITDSCHGASFAILFERPFVCLTNRRRGFSRFASLMDMLGLEDRFVCNTSDLIKAKILGNNIDWVDVRQTFSVERIRSVRWLKDALGLNIPDGKPTKNISIVGKSNCSGCGSCSVSCPLDAITMKEDESGVSYPVVCAEKCANCGKCIAHCPALQVVTANGPSPEAFALAGPDDLRKASSSGAAFSLLAEEVFKRHGYVSGAVFDADYHLSHVMISDVGEMPKLRRSKYVQSDTAAVYVQVQEKLNNGSFVLYVGCPCQVAGLKAFLGKTYENLVSVDLLCAGAPTASSFRAYLRDCHFSKPISYVGFRDKDPFPWEVNSMGMTVRYNDGSAYQVNKWADPYFRSVVKGYIKREHCSVCKYAAIPRVGDLTIGDFWGVQRYDPRLTDGLGTSIVIVNNKKGGEFLKCVRGNAKIFAPISVEYILTSGQPLASASKTTSPRRDEFLRMLADGTTFKKVLGACEQRFFDLCLYGGINENVQDVLDVYSLYRLCAMNGYSVKIANSSQRRPYRQKAREFWDRQCQWWAELRKDNSYYHVERTCGRVITTGDRLRSFKEQTGLSARRIVEIDSLMNSSLSPILLAGREILDCLKTSCSKDEHYTAVFVSNSKIQFGDHKCVLVDPKLGPRELLTVLVNADEIITNQRLAFDVALLCGIKLRLVEPDDTLIEYVKSCHCNLDLSDREKSLALIEQERKRVLSNLECGLKYISRFVPIKKTKYLLATRVRRKIKRYLKDKLKSMRASVKSYFKAR